MIGKIEIGKNISSADKLNILKRKWMIIDENGNFLTQRQEPRMALVQPIIKYDYMELSAPGVCNIKVSLIPSKNKIKCRVWKSFIDGYLYGGEVKQWLSTFLKRDNIDLVCFTEDLEPRKIKEFNTLQSEARDLDVTVYADFSPYMLVSESSLNDLNSRLENFVSMKNFRPNFVVSGCEAFAEVKFSKFLKYFNF